jgi:hypothetical protein
MTNRTSAPALLAAALVLLLLAGAGPQPEPRFVGVGPTRAFADGSTPAAAGSRAAASAWWGGTYTASTGEQVRVYLSDSYPVDEARAQYWADTLAGLVHGKELSRLTAYFAPLEEISRLCGASAAGCYSAADNMLLAPGESVGSVSAEAVLTHEYGHHVANNRQNPPWRAIDWGAKRWASNARICSRERAGTAFPSGGERYRLDPGEAFAEAYRAMNETRAGHPDFAWSLVDGSFRPDAAALRLVYEDVVHPWTLTRRRIVGRLGGSGRNGYETLLATPYDGRVSLTLTGPPQFRLLVVDAFTGRLLASGRRVARTICGERTLLLRVAAGGTPGRFSLTISRP